MTNMTTRSSDPSSTTSSDLDEKDYTLKQQQQQQPVVQQRGINTLDKYQIEISFLLLSSLYLSDKFYPQVKPYTSKFLHLQYRYPGTDYYDIGRDDWCFVFTAIFLITFIRATTMNYVLRPLARSLGIHKRKLVQRFMEQGWYLIYYSISFPMGAYILYHSNYATNFDNLYIGWPHDQMSFLFKGYYLLEMACWLQQIFILNIEDRRKDHYQMFSHHIITCLLVGGSYYYYFTKIGNVILVIMDLVDIFFAAAKLLKYSGFQTSCDLMFGLFVIVWIALRHGLYNYIFYHTATKARDLMMSGKCIEGVIQKRCWTDNVITIFLSLLGGLQIITIIWMYLIAKVAVKVITGAPAEDVRSDDEED